MAGTVKTPWREEEVKKLKDMYANGVDTRVIAQKLGRTRRSIRGKAHCLGLTHKVRDEYLYTLAEDAFLIEHAKKMTRAEIGKAIGRSEGSVSRRGKRLEIEFQDPSKKAKYTKNMNFFSNPNIFNSYLAGWIASDGWVRTISSEKLINQVGISVAKKDIAFLEYFKTVTEFSGDIREYKANEKYPQAELRICGVPQWLEDLRMYWSLTPNKTYTIQPPNLEVLSRDQILAYHVGLIEGDGHIRMTNQTLMISFVTASKVFADWVEHIWQDVVGAAPSRSQHRTGKAYYVQLYGKNARNLCRELFKLKVHQLDRKWDIALHEIERWDLRE